MINNTIEQLQQQIAAEQKKMQQCAHKFGEPFSDPETTKEPYGFKQVGHGSDVYTEAEGWKDVLVPRWTRICTICGAKEHTYT